MELRHSLLTVHLLKNATQQTTKNDLLHLLSAVTLYSIYIDFRVCAVSPYCFRALQLFTYPQNGIFRQKAPKMELLHHIITQQQCPSVKKLLPFCVCFCFQFQGFSGQSVLKCDNMWWFETKRATDKLVWLVEWYSFFCA